MKRIVLCVLLAAVMILTACGVKKTTENGGRPDPLPDGDAITAIDHCAVEPDERRVMSDSDMEMYRRLMDAVLERRTKVKLGADVQKTAFLIDLLRESPYGFFVSDYEMTSGSMSLSYAYSERRQKMMLELMDSELLKIVNHQFEPDDNELDIILKIYHAVTQKLTYDHTRTDNKEVGSPLFDHPGDEVYKALRDNKALCYGYANVLRFALLQRGIECYCVHGECKANKMGHEWVIFKYKGKYYHCDPAWDRAEDGESKLMHFGTTDGIRESETVIQRPFSEYHTEGSETPVCDDGRFDNLRGMTYFCAVGGHRFYLEDSDEKAFYYDTVTGMIDD